MPFRRLGVRLMERALLFLLAGLTAVMLLHVQAGLQPPGNRREAAVFRAENWIKASGDYLSGLTRGDLGIVKPFGAPGYTREQPVTKLLREQVPRSLSLLGAAVAVSLLLGTLLGMAGSRFGARWMRPVVLTGSLALLSTPDILVVFLLRRLVIWGLSTFDIQIMKVATLGAVTPADMVAPALALSALPLALVARVAAVAFDEVYDQLYIRTARSKGIHPFRVLTRHALKNAWIRVADAGPLLASIIVTGLVVVEFVFYYPGLGRTLGLMLERGGQPVAASSIALALLIGAVVLDSLLGAVRLLLDPRLESGREQRESGPRLHWRDLAVAAAGLPGAIVAWFRNLPYAASQAVWAWRPSRWLAELRRYPALLIGGTVFLVMVALALFGGQLADLRTIHNAPKYIVVAGKVWFPPYKPGLTGFVLGSDVAGRDLLARLLVGARYTLFFTLAVTPVRFLIALPWGLMAGFRGGLWSGSGRTLSLTLSAMPVILVPAALLPLRGVLGPDATSSSSFWLITGILAVVGIPRLVESIRLQVEATLVQPFVEGARAAGAGASRILSRHVLPHLAPQLWVTAAADMAWTLLLLAQLGVFGIYLGGRSFVATGTEVLSNSSGVDVPNLPDWSSMLSRPYDVIYRAPWAVWVPAVAFLAAVASLNLMAEGLRRRAQSLSSAPAVPEAVPGPDGVPRIPAPARRRLALEWTAGLLVLTLMGGAAVKYSGTGRPALAAGQENRDESPMGRARYELQLVLDAVYGTGDGLERAKQVVRVRQVVTTYLDEAFKEGLNATEMQEDSRGRINLFGFQGVVRLVQVQVPGASVGSHLFFQDLSGPTAGRIWYHSTLEKPALVALLPGDVRRIVLSGTVPGPDHWVFTSWRYLNNAGWVRDSRTIEDLFARIPKEYKASLVEGPRGQTGSSAIQTNGGPLNSIHVHPDGRVEICLSLNGPCHSIPWTESGYAGP